MLQVKVLESTYKKGGVQFWYIARTWKTFLRVFQTFFMGFSKKCRMELKVAAALSYKRTDKMLDEMMEMRKFILAGMFKSRREKGWNGGAHVLHSWC